VVSDRDKREKEIPDSFSKDSPDEEQNSEWDLRSGTSGKREKKRGEEWRDEAKGGRYITIKPRILRELCPRSESRGISRGAVCRYQNSVTMATHQLSNAASSLRNLHADVRVRDGSSVCPS